ncbi:MAG: hypothetical protein MUF21_13250 [Gemmatimonadaceae bacterium]|nr:hypothetical protein [Gemmatimonadaceae bacterium]
MAGLATRGLAADLVALVVGQHELIVPEGVLTKLSRVLVDTFRMPGALVDTHVAALRRHTVVPRGATPLSIEIRDPDDAWVVTGAVDGEASLLVTGDRDLLDIADRALIGRWRRIRVASARRSPQPQPAVDLEHRAGDEGVVDEERDRVGHLVGATDATERRHRRVAREGGRLVAGREHVPPRRVDDARRHRVHAHRGARR